MWTLLYHLTGVEKTAAAWGIDAESIQLTLGNQVADTLDLTFDGLPFDADVPFAYKQLVTLKRAGVPVFSGRVRTTPRRGEAGVESVGLTIHGPWDELERTIFEQEWNTNSGSELASISRVIMGQSLEGGRQNTALCVVEIFNYATACGLNVQLGSNMAEIEIVYSEVREQSLAALLRRYLAHQPSAVVSFDYSTTPPTLNIVDRPDATAIALTIDGVRVSSVQLTPRHDLVVPGVIIRYLVSTTIDGNTGTDVVSDIYPAETNPLAMDVFKASFDIDGGSSQTTTQKQKLTVRALPTSNWTDVEWWKTKIEWLNNPQVTDFTIEPDGMGFSYPWGDQGQSAFYDNEIVSGSFQEWMSHLTSPALHCVRGKVRAYCTFKYTDPTTNAESIRRSLIEASVVSTNAASSTYKKSDTTVTPGEEMPTGLAEALYRSMSELQYDGSIQLIEQEALATPIRPGMVVNLSGGRAEWETMRAQIQQVSVSLHTGTTVITVGPSKHLGVDDLMRLLQPIRLQVRPTNDQTRETGRSKKDQSETDGTLAVPDDNGSLGAGTPRKTEWSDKEDTTKLITIDASNTPEIRIRKTGGGVKEIRLAVGDIPAGCTSAIYLREIDVCVDGVAKKIAVPCSAPY